MNFCSKCGHQLNSMNEVCPNCGYQNTVEVNYDQNVSPVQNNYNSTGQYQTKEGYSTGMLIWAIINILCCCPPFGIPGLIFAILAKSAPTPDEAQSKIKIAKILNILGTVLGIIGIILYFIFVVAAAGAGAYNY